MKGIFLCDLPMRMAAVWSHQQQERLRNLVDLPPHCFDSTDLLANREWLSETKVIFSTWGMPLLSHEQLQAMPKLEAVFYAAGSVKEFAQPLLDRDIMIVSAASANAVPVAEYTLSQILFALKLGWNHIRQFQEHRGPAGWHRLSVPGVYGSTVGIISLGMIGRQLCELLKPFSVEKLAYDPFAEESFFTHLGLRRAGTLEELFASSDVVTLHAPWLPETEKMITGDLLALMKPSATFINTSRGALVDESGLIRVLEKRPDLTAILDVTLPEPPIAGSPLYHMENVILTPHIAGSIGREMARMSDLMIEEFIAWKEGQPLRHSIARSSLEKLA